MGTAYVYIADVRTYSDKVRQLSCQTVMVGSYAAIRRKYNQLPTYRTFSNKYFAGYSHFLQKNDENHSIYLNITKCKVVKVKGGVIYEPV